MDSVTPRPHFIPGKDPVAIVQEAGWVPGPVWTGGKSRPYRDSTPDRPARSQSLYRLSYRTHQPIIGLRIPFKTLLIIYSFLKAPKRRQEEILIKQKEHFNKEERN